VDKPQVIEGISYSQYSAIEAEHSGVMRKILTSPLAYKTAKDAEAAGIDEDKDALRLGRATHTAVLEPQYFAEQYVCWSGGTRRGEVWNNYKEVAANNGQTILKEDQLDAAVAIGKAVRAHPVAGPIVSAPGRAELTIVWEHPRTGILIKVRLDYVTGKILADLKSCRDPSARQFCKSATDLGYHVQMALYSDAAAAAGLGALEVNLIAAQSASPFDVVVYEMDENALFVGRQNYEKALDMIVACRESGKWPGQATTGKMPFKLPAYADIHDDDQPDESSPIADAEF
jgi:hypothetical protein